MINLLYTKPTVIVFFIKEKTFDGHVHVCRMDCELVLRPRETWDYFGGIRRASVRTEFRALNTLSRPHAGDAFDVYI